MWTFIRLQPCLYTGSDLFYRLWFVQPEMTDFEVRGTLNIVEACANSSVKRLVLTSSLSTMVWDQQRHPEKVIDEKCWSNLDFCRSKKVHHLLPSLQFYFNYVKKKKQKLEYNLAS